MAASEAEVVKLKKEKHLETINAFLIRSYKTTNRGYERHNDEVTVLLDEGFRETPALSTSQSKLFKSRSEDKYYYYKRNIVENDLKIEELEPRGRFYSTVLARRDIPMDLMTMVKLEKCPKVLKTSPPTLPNMTFK